MKRYSRILFLLTALLASIPAFAEEQANERIIAGWLEMVVLSPGQIQLKAKLDSGAKTSSIHAENIERFERDGKTWVRFDLPKGRNKNEVQHSIEKPLFREVKIKRHKLPPMKRSVVKLPFCIDGYHYTAQFTLADRGISIIRCCWEDVS
nr:ATP-dependent zinc protease [Methylomarinum sp. Ch1-1]MDP4519997.1 ATP-dependent zinc protease [Methylomarinum sp. Ch1-1]